MYIQLTGTKNQGNQRFKMPQILHISVSEGNLISIQHFSPVKK